MLNFDGLAFDISATEAELVEIEYSLNGVICTKLPFGIDKNDEKAVSVWAIRHLINKMNTKEGFNEIISNLFAVMDNWHDINLNAVTKSVQEDEFITSLSQPEHFYYKRASYFEIEACEKLENQLSGAEYKELQEKVSEFRKDLNE